MHLHPGIDPLPNRFFSFREVALPCLRSSDVVFVPMLQMLGSLSRSVPSPAMCQPFQEFHNSPSCVVIIGVWAPHDDAPMCHHGGSAHSVSPCELGLSSLNVTQ